MDDIINYLCGYVSWVRTLRAILNAAKSIEIQKEYEQHLKAQFASADDNRNGTLTVDEFAGLLHQVRKEIAKFSTIYM